MASNGTKNAQAPKQVNAPRQVEFMEPKILKAPGRQRPYNLRPLSTTHIKPEQRPRGSPYPYHSDSPYRESPETPKSAISLATPSLAGVRKYYRQNGLHTAFQSPLSPSPPPFTPDRSRRYSGLSSSGLVTRFDGLHATSPLSANSSPTKLRRSFAEESRDMLLAGTSTKRSELSRASSVSADSRDHRSEPRSSNIPSRRLGKPPPGRLREYGHVYLGNVASADIFVRAMHSRVRSQNKGRRESVMSNNGDDDNYITIPQSDSDHVVIRARVVPFSKERKPFLIQRRFSKADIEASRPPAAEKSKEEREEKNGKSNAGSTKGDEGAENESQKKSALQVAPEEPASTPSPQPAPAAESLSPQKETPEPTATGPKRRVMPIHRDYALKYLPILGAIMLSGYIRRGDTIDMPLPHPEAWSETVAYVYTGVGAVSDAIKANVAHLAGTVEEGR
ncbi:hypothetical protein VE03_04542 [Pseudogymnoascus sp. 23342-1-I1]|nr:hypothetical protein VE03_04542 [Pseudogymnoascus sp. 23342-1-I1]